jgi:cAMP phosphodiesterase
LKFELLPSTFEPDGSASRRQHLSCLIIDNRIALDAGSLGMAATEEHRRQVRDIVLTHAHLDHIAGLPLFIDDVFAGLGAPVHIYALAEVIEILERDIFNWSVYPRFSELKNDGSSIVEYHPLVSGQEIKIGGIDFKSFPVEHKVPSVGFIISDSGSTVAYSGDTAGLAGLKVALAKAENLKAIIVECAFPDEMAGLASISHHMTPSVLAKELADLERSCPVYVVNIKPNYRFRVLRQIYELHIDGLEVLEVGKPYFW